MSTVAPDYAKRKKSFSVVILSDAGRQFVRSSFGSLANVECFIYPPTRQTATNTMLATTNIKMFLAEAATAAAILPCRHSFDERRRSGYVSALAESDAR